jgi:hypothetical protein
MTLDRAELASIGGLVAGPLAWAISTQLGPILAGPDCRASFPLTFLACAFCALLALAGAAVSWRALEMRPARRRGASRFVCLLSIFMALVLTFALLLQAAASLVLTGCER